MKYGNRQCHSGTSESPSTRREWIEMLSAIIRKNCSRWSPSTRREWIEICASYIKSVCFEESPSTRREWIEIVFSAPSGSGLGTVSLHTEGVD